MVKEKMFKNVDLFFRRKPALTVLSLRGKAKYGSIIARETDCTYSHTVKVLQILKKLNLVDFDKQGRIKFVKLTKKGSEIAECLEKIKSLIE